MNLFTVFPIGATIQDGGKRKRSDVLFILFVHLFVDGILLTILFQFPTLYSVFC